MSICKLGGRGRLMRPAVLFAEANDFTVAFTRGNHLAFYGYNGRVIAAGMPRSGQAALRAIQKRKALIRGLGVPGRTNE